MVEQLIAYCGIDCGKCPAFIGTQTNNHQLLADTAEEWIGSSQQGDIDDIMCDGCTVNKRMHKFCSECAVRNCAIGRNLINCGWCDEYPCATLSRYWELFDLPDQRKNLDEEKRKKEAGGIN